MTTRMKRLVVLAACVGFGGVDASAETAASASAGTSFTCAATTSGGVQCWGQNTTGQLGDGTTISRPTPAPVSGLSSGVLAIATGQSHACALTSGGGVVCWGSNFAGQLGDGTTTFRLTPTAVSGLGSGVLAISAASNHTCAVAAGGAAKCWGSNYAGQVGDGSTTDRWTPRPVSGLSSGVLSITAGYGHSCAVTTGGAATCWGYNANGQLGDGTTTNRLVPTPVSGLSSGASAVVAAYDHTCALSTGGAATCWGDNSLGQLGDGTTTNRVVPTPVSGLASGVLSIAANYAHTFAVTAGGAATSWGYNVYGQLGDGTMANRSTPTPVSGLSSGVLSIAAGQIHTCAVTTGGGVTCWGNNAYGQLGDGATTDRPTPTQVSRLGSDVASIVAGSTHTCAVTTGGSAACSGFNLYGHLGDGTTTSRLVPTPVTGLGSGVAAIAAGVYHTCAVIASGAVACWGNNAYGQLGDGTTTNRPTPTPVSGLDSGVLAVAAGYNHACAVTSGGAVKCWGYNNVGQLGDGTTTNRSIPTAVSGLSSGVLAIAAGYRHTCAVTAGGAVKCWGENSSGQLGDGTYDNRLTPTPVFGLASGIAAVAAAPYHTCAVTTGGAAKCWGYNYAGQLGDGTTSNQVTPSPVSGLASGVLSIAANYNHTCAVTTGGGALCWGDNYSGQLGDGTHESHLTPTPVFGLASGTAGIAAGYYYTCALTTGVGVTCWGQNSSGQFGTGERVVGVTPLAVYGFGGAIAAGTITPIHGSAGGGTAVTITGAYFLQGATVTIGGVAAVPVSVISTTEILAVTGPHAPGAADVAVSNPDAQQATITGGFTYDAAGAPVGDFTGDLKTDVLWRHATLGEVWLWPMDGAAKTAETFIRTVADTDWEIRGLGDQNGDGNADILWRNKTTGQIYFWPMDGATPLSENYVGTVDPAYDIVGTSDYNGDNKADILWRHLTNGDAWIWLMNGATPLSEVYVDTVDPGYVVKGSGDLNGDHKADIVWHHATTGEVWVWLMNGTTPLSQTWVATVPDVGYKIMGVADHTGDGKADILWHHATRGEVWIWTMDGPTRVAETWVATVPETDYRIVGTGDYNGDSKADILWHHATRGEVWVWLMNGTTKVSETLVATVPEVGYQIIR